MSYKSCKLLRLSQKMRQSLYNIINTDISRYYRDADDFKKREL